jgi:hypothetical protein
MPTQAYNRAMSPTLAKRALVIVLASIVAAWLLVMASTFTDLFVTPVYVDGVYTGDDPAVRASTYFFVGAVAIVSAATLVAQRLAIRARIDAGPHALLPRATHRFTTLMIVISLGFATILGVSVFVQSFPGGREQAEVGTRLFTTYLPIILYTAIIVTVLLVGFVFRTDKLPKTSANTTPSPSPATAPTPASASGSRALGGAYAVPIIAAAIALIFGLVVYDITRTRLELWIWVIIHVIVAVGIVIGTVLASRAMREEADQTSSRARITRSSGILNFVLSIVFIAIVLGMGFGTGASSIEGLRISPQLYIDIYAGESDQVGDVVVSANGWDLAPDSVVTVAIDETGDVLLTGPVGQFRDFFGQQELPDSLPAGSYRITGVAIGVDGKEVTNSRRFTVRDDLTVELRSLSGPQWIDTTPTIMQADWSWGVRDMLPAITILFIGLITTYVTVIARNREETPAN